MSARAVGRPARDGGSPRRSGLLAWLTAVFALEALGLVAVLVLLIVQIVTAGRDVDLSSAIALAVLTAVGVLLLVALARGARAARPWILAAGVVWQLVQLFVGLAAFQGAGAQPVLGAIVVIPALAGLALLFSPPVRSALRRPDRAG